MRGSTNPGVWYALGAAALFGASTPLSKVLLVHVAPGMLAALLYLGSGVGLAAWRLFRGPASAGETPLRAADLPWLAGSILFGGVAGPLLLMLGLSALPAASASLLLNLEGVLTALLAWFAFGENFDRRIMGGMFSIVCGGILLSWSGGGGSYLSWGAMMVVLACLGWALDNNLTRRIAAGDPLQIAMAKGLVAGAVNLAIALGNGQALPAAPSLLLAAAVGVICYGSSLTLFVLALRHLGTARTGAYFSIAPFLGVTLSVAFLREPVSWRLVAAALLMAFGVWLHLTERHVHPHRHDLIDHEHRHNHDDEHHAHEHADADPPTEHTHRHVHHEILHSHPHYPDTHHHHEH